MEYYRIEEIEIIKDGENSPENKADYPVLPPNKMSFFEKISFWSTLLMIFILPLFTYNPFPGFSLDFGKKAIFFGLSVVALVFWLLARFEDGRFIFPGGFILKSWLLVLLSYIISSLLLFKGEGGVSNSVFGLGYDTDTLIFAFFLFVLMFLSSIFFQSVKRLSYFYIALVSSVVLVGVTELIQLYTGGTLLVGNGGMVTNLIGKWNDMGIFFGLGVVLSLSAVELLELKSYPKYILWATFLLSLSLVGIVNYSPVFITVGLISLLVFVYSIFFNKDEEPLVYSNKLFLRPSVFAILVCVILFFSQVRVGEFLTKMNIINIDVRPSFSATYDIAQKTMGGSYKNLFFGSGPNTFSSQWVKFKPDVVNNTIFWNIDFNAGIGRILSYSVTMGLFGLLSWLLFIGLIFYYGFWTILYSNSPKPVKFIAFISFMGAVYLWVFSLFYVPESVIFILSFSMTGVFLASLVRAGTIRNFEFSFLNDPRLGFASVLVLVLLVITNISVGYLLSKKFLAGYAFQDGVYNLNYKGDIESAENLFKKAAVYDEQDIYHRNLSDLNILKLRKFISEQKIADKESISKLQEIIVSASASARRSIELNNKNYLNHIALGKVGEAVVPLKVVEGSYELALDSYNKSLSLYPGNPMTYLNMARLEIANNNIDKAKEFLNQALSRKNNFTAALYLLSQIEASQGNLKNAVERSEQAYLLAPDDLGILFQLGFLKFTSGDYKGSVSALEKAVSISNQYSNAKYFLGLSYAKLKRNTDALNQFKDIAILNPENEEVKMIIKNLTQGKEPFAGTKVVEPENRGELPFKDN